MSAVDGYLRCGHVITLEISENFGHESHAITVWGYEYGKNGDYTGIYVTSSDDSKLETSELQYCSVFWDEYYSRWELGDGYYNWHIDTVISPDYKPMPEPGTIFLVGFGLIGLAVTIRRLKQMGDSNGKKCKHYKRLD
ncbi:MAG: PEP-CTERM sorting domain-containing protein [Desulfobacteraceae bacterium]|nr:PEP-CTERM sorting domain-containing protein [Desulfobacteraceae bacterium]